LGEELAKTFDQSDQHRGLVLAVLTDLLKGFLDDLLKC
jgi:hypothetical protein